MARDNILLTYVGLDILFVSTGALLIVFALNNQAESAKEFTKDTVVRDLLLGMCPLNGNNPLLPVPHHAPSHHEQNTDLEKCIAAIGNAVLVFVTFLISIPAIVMPSTRGWLKFHGYLTVICAFFTLVIGLDIWFETLKTRKNLSDIWITQPPATQSLLQQTVCLPHPLFFPPTLLFPSISLSSSPKPKHQLIHPQLQCCGYSNSTSPPFVQDTFCTSAIQAASQLGCVTPFSREANNFLDLVFTGAFGIVGLDAVLVITTAILLKDRKEKERYRFIDEKSGAGAF